MTAQVTPLRPLTGSARAKELDVYCHGDDESHIDKVIDEAPEVVDEPSPNMKGTTGEIALHDFCVDTLFNRFKCDIKEAIGYAEVFNQINIIPELRTAQVADVVADAYVYNLQRQQSTVASELQPSDAVADSSRLRVKDVSELKVNTKLLKLVQGLLGYMQLIIAYGASGSGKSFVLLYLALCIVTGRDWYGRKVTKGAVVYVVLEGASGFGNRVHAWIKHHGLKPDDVRGFGLIDGGIDLLREGKPTDAHIITEQIRAFEQSIDNRVVLVIIDTLSQAVPGADENSAKDMTRALERMKYIGDTLGASVLAIHHTGKDESKGIRGFSGLRGNIDTALSIADNEITTNKMRDGDDRQSFRFRLAQVDVGRDEDGVAIQSCVALPDASAAPRVDPLKRGSQAEAAFKCLAKLISIEPADDRPECIFAGPVVAEDTWRKGCRSVTLASGEPDAERKAFHRVRRELVSRGYVEISNGYAGITAAGHSVTTRDKSRSVTRDGQGHTPIGVSHVTDTKHGAPTHGL